MHSIYRDRIRTASTEQLQTVLAFFDVAGLREHYTGLIGDIRRELVRREAVLPGTTKLEANPPQQSR